MSTQWPPPYPKCQDCAGNDGRDVYLNVRNKNPEGGKKHQLLCRDCFGQSGIGEATLLSRTPNKPDNV